MASKKHRRQNEKEISKSLPISGSANEPARTGGDSSQGKSSGSSRREQTANSAMNLDTYGLDQVPVQPKLQKRFYEALVLMAVLGKNRGVRLEEEDFDLEPDTNDPGGEKLRRSFIRNLAYLCDFETGGDRTTAFALEQTRRGIVYWFASNKYKPKQEDSTKLFAEKLLWILQQSGTSQAGEIERNLFESAVEFSSKRISHYAKMLEKEIQEVMKGMTETRPSADNSFLTWLKNLRIATSLPTAICQMCYDSRGSSNYEIVQARARLGQPYALSYENIRHLIGRLNHTLKAIKVLIETKSRLPHLFDAFEIKRARSSFSSPPPLSERNPTLIEIAGRLARDIKSIELLRHNLEELDRLHNLSEQLRKQYQTRTWRPRVHAELILLDLFWVQNLKFVENDKYIGGSKPACYCCYHYITAHPGRFVAPACHNNLWLKWKAPDIRNHKKTQQIKDRETFLQKMVERIRTDVLAQIIQRRGPGSWRPDSLTEISVHYQRDLEGFLTDDAQGSNSDSMSESDSSEKSDANNEFDDLKFKRNVAQDESEEEEDDEPGGVQLFAALTI